MWDSKQVALRVGQGTLEDIDSDSLWPVEEHTASCGAPATPFSAGEIAYFKSAAYIAQRFHDCGKDIHRPAPEAPSSLELALAPGKIAGIVVAVLAVLGAGAAFAVSAGVVPGVVLPL